MADEIEPILSQAKATHGRGDLNEAESLYRKVLGSDPKNAEALHNLGAVALQTGHPDAAVYLFRKTLQSDPKYTDAFCNLGLALRAQGLLDEAAVAYEKAIEAAPDMAEAHSNLGVVLKEQGDSDGAAKCYRRAIQIAPKLADAHCNLGILLHEEGILDAAAESLETAMRAAPDNPIIEANLGAVMADLERHEEAGRLLKQALQRLPQNHEILFNIGRAAFAGGQLDRAVKFFRLAIRSAPEFAAAHHSLAHALLARGELAEGWLQYDWRWRAKNFSHALEAYPYPKWNGSPLLGKRLLIWDEQGVGDKLLFAGLVPELLATGAECVLETDPRLVELLQRSLGDATVIPFDQGSNTIRRVGRFDFQLPIGDLPRWLRPDAADFQPLGSYLIADEGLQNILRRRYKQIKGGLIAGISWASNPPKGLSLEAFVPVLSQPGITWVNLQYGDHSKEIFKLWQEYGIEIHTDPDVDPNSDLDGFAAQVAAMDFVITIQNTTLYVAGGLGVHTLALTGPAPDWRWFGGASKLSETPVPDPWHESVTLFKRKPGARPDAAIEAIAGHLRKKISLTT
ncbi:MAG: tetratricopeptide repeat protein [Pseudomonadota bacterium]|nr:tetratricopeptide repeat protein [Pseudomonadota bacterium]